MSAKDVGAPPKARVVHSTLSSRIGMTFWLVLTAVLVALPYWGDRQMMRLATEIYSFVALASLWNFLAGYAGWSRSVNRLSSGSAAIRSICALCGPASIRWSDYRLPASSAR